MEMNYCRRCGQQLSQINPDVFQCGNGHTLFANSAPTAAIFILNEQGNLLLSRRGINPGKGMLDTFGGFVDGAESAEAAAIRELQEEAGITPDQYETLRYFYSAPATYEYQGEDRNVLTLCFYTRIKPGVTLIAADDVASVVERDLHDITDDELFNDDIKTGLREFRNLLSSLQ